MTRILAKLNQHHELDGVAPTELRIFAAGDNPTTKGTFRFTKRSAELVMAENAEYGNDRSADYEHQALAQPPVKAPASAWYDLELRDTPNGPELWAANIRWTDNARALIEAKEYRYTSPAFYHDADGEILGYRNFALTNNPATLNLRPLIAASARAHAAELGLSIQELYEAAAAALAAKHGYVWLVEFYLDELIYESAGRLYSQPITVTPAGLELTGDPVEVRRTYTPISTTAPTAGASRSTLTPPQEGTPMKTTTRLLAALGLMAGMTITDENEDAALEALTGLQKRADLADQLTALVPEGKDAVGTVTGWRDAAARLTTIEAERTAEQEAAREARVTELLEAGLRDGKLTPASRDALTAALADADGRVDPARLEAYLTAAPRVTPAGAAREKAPSAAGDKPVDTKGRTFAELSNPERAQLRHENPAEFTRLWTEHCQTLSRS